MAIVMTATHAMVVDFAARKIIEPSDVSSGVPLEKKNIRLKGIVAASIVLESGEELPFDATAVLAIAKKPKRRGGAKRSSPSTGSGDENPAPSKKVKPL